MCSDLIGVATGLAGLGALFYIAHRIWQSLARGEPIDVYGLLRPFAIGLCIMFFPVIVLGSLNAILNPLVVGTHEMLRDAKLDMEQYQRQKDKLEWEYDLFLNSGVIEPNEDFDRQLQRLGLSEQDEQALDVMYNIYNLFSPKQMFLNAVRWLLEILFETASLVIDTIRTFYLIVLSIFGPLAFAFSVYDGFQSTLTGWLSRYITVYLWLPVCDLFSAMLSKLNTLSLQRDIELIGQQGWLPDASNTTYIIIMIVGICGYFVVPSLSSWIVQAGSMGAYNRKISSLATKAGNVAGAIAGAISGNVAGRLITKK